MAFGWWGDSDGDIIDGCAGFIGSHTCVELLNSGYDVVIADDLSNSKIKVIDRIEQITGKRPKFYKIDVADKAALEPVFAGNSIDAVIHFAGFKAVGQSCEQPLMYYRNNLDSTLTLLELMRKYNVKSFVFSSSATVYCSDAAIPYVESVKTGGCTSPYAWTKFMIEQINLGTGVGYSVLDVVKAFESANNLKIPYVIKPRRDGDLPEYYSDAHKAEELLGWHAKRDLQKMCAESWNWQKNNPNGYED